MLQGQQVVEDLDAVGESTANLHEVLQLLDTRWCEVNRTIDSKQKELNQSGLAQQIRKEVGSLGQTLDTHRRWLESTEGHLLTTKSEELKKVHETCKVRVQSVRSHEEKLKKMKEQVKQLEPSVSTTVQQEVQKVYEGYHNLAFKLGNMSLKIIFKLSVFNYLKSSYLGRRKNRPICLGKISPYVRELGK